MKRLLAILGLVLVGGILVFVSSRKPSHATRPGSGLSPESTTASAASSKLPNAAGPGHQRAATADRPEITTNAPTSADWSERVEAARAVEESDAEKSVRLLALFSSLPPEGQDEIAPELAALTPDANFSTLTGILTDVHTPESVMDVLMTDLLDRPENVQLPTLLDIAKNSQHPKAAEALDLLETTLGENFGSDWDAWSKKISERLASRPE